MKRITNSSDIENGLASLHELDPRLVLISEKAGPLPLRLQEPGFAGLARIIIGQQVSRASADAIHRRFVELISPLTPHGYREAGEEAWIKIGLSRPKQKTFEHLTQAIMDGTFPIDELATMPADEAMSIMTSIKGIGPWTAEVYLLFCSGHPDIFPAGDLALCEAVGRAFDYPKRPNEKDVREIAQNWSPYRGIAARLFWAYYKVLKEGRGALPI